MVHGHIKNNMARLAERLCLVHSCISVTHEALGTVRVMKTGGMMGEVVGMANAIMKKHQCLPRDVYAQHLGELKELMAAGVPGAPTLE